jgi:preprotein translocase subunit SecE
VTNTLKDNAVTRYFRDTWAELKKVRWPSREEAQNLTLIVVAVTVSMAIILGLMDLFFSWEFRGLIDAKVVNLVIAGVLLLAGLVGFVLAARE